MPPPCTLPILVNVRSGSVSDPMAETVSAGMAECRGACRYFDFDEANFRRRVAFRVRTTPLM